jgi:hypothetical protein
MMMVMVLLMMFMAGILRNNNTVFLTELTMITEHMLPELLAL